MEHHKGFICFANSHMTVLAHQHASFRAALKKALLILPDGKPLAIACSLLYNQKQERIAGMDFMPALLAQLDNLGGKIFLYGSTDHVLELLKERINVLYPGVEIVGSISPSFSGTTAEENAMHIRQINESGANFVLVALGCPKQEIWMAKHYKAINAILLGVGGAFPVLAGVQKRSPKFMQSLSLEWLYRLQQEPKRLFKRYLFTNVSFMYLLSRQIAQKHVPFRKTLIPLEEIAEFQHSKNKVSS